MQPTLWEKLWTLRWLENLVQDVRYAARSMVHNRAFTIVAVVSLALGIGANTAIYSFMESILLRALPVQQPESLVVMRWRAAKGFTSASSKGMSWSTGGSHVDSRGYVGTQFPYPALKLFQDNDEVFSAAFCYFSSNLSVSVNDETEVVKAQYVSGNYFNGMGVHPFSGRLLMDGDDVAGAPSAAVLSHRFSERRFGNAGNAIGKTIRLNNKPFTVEGVVPPAFFGAESGEVPDIYVPMRAELVLRSGTNVGAAAGWQFLDPNYYWIEVMGRLKPGVVAGSGSVRAAVSIVRR